MLKNIITENKNLLGKCLVLISFFLLIYMFICPLNSVYIHLDEYFTTNLLRFSFDWAWSKIVTDVHPPLYYLILFGFINFLKFLNIPFDLIYASKIVSIIPFCLIFIISVTKIKKDYNWLVSGLFIFSIAIMENFFIAFHTIRMYSWGLLFLVIAFIYLGDVYKKSDLKSWILFTFFSICSIYIHNISLFSIGIMYLLLLIHIYLMNVENKKKMLLFKTWFCSALILFISYIPWLFILLNQMSQSHSNGGVVTLEGIVSCLVGYTTIGSNIIISVLALIFLILITGFAIYNYLKNFNNNNAYILTGILSFLLTYLIAICILPLIFGAVVSRYLVPVYGILWFSISILIGTIEDNKLKVDNKKLFSIMLVLMLILGVSSFVSTMDTVDKEYKEGYNELKTLEKMNNNNSVVIYKDRWLAQYYVFYLNNSKIYFLLDNKDKNTTNITHILETFPHKNVYIINKKINDTEPDFGDNVEYKQIAYRDSFKYYRINLKNDTTY